MDLALRNGSLIDGSGAPRYRGDIGISDGRIVAVGDVPGKAREEVDVGGAAIAPGFIDNHTHYDAQAMWDPMLSPSVYHGVTTVIGGNCGFTLAPLSGDAEDTDYLLRMLSCVEGMPLSTLRQALHPDWRAFGEYLDRLDGNLAINSAFLVGHSALRRAVMGERSVGHEASSEELDRMCDLLDRSLAEGGVGFSTTISYTHNDYENQPVPSRWANREELLALAAVTRKHPGTWLELVLGKPAFGDEEHQLLSDLSTTAQRPVNWNLLIADAQARRNVESQMAAGDYARARGGTVYGLVPAGPIKAIITFYNSFPLSLVSAWTDIMILPREQRLAALADPATRARMIAGVEAKVEGADTIGDPRNIRIESVALPKNSHLVGKSLGEVAANKRHPLEVLFDLAVEEELRTTFATVRGDDPESWDMRVKMWKDDRCLIGGSDAGAHLDILTTFALSTQLLGEGVRTRRLLELEDAVRRITAVQADRFGLKARGRLNPGHAADLVVFDPDEIACGPLQIRHDLPGEEMRLYADAIGISQVVVNGVCVVRDGAPTGRLGGRVLRSGRDTETVALPGKRH